MIIFAADHPLVLDGTYDREGYTPKDRRALDRATRRQSLGLDTPRVENVIAVASPSHPGGNRMRFFDCDHVGCYLDHINHRVERTSDERETKMIDLTLRVQPFTPELAGALDPDVRAVLFSLGDATPKPKLKRVHFDLTVERQQLTIAPLPELDGRFVLEHCEVGGVRARTEKGVNGFALVFDVSYGPASARELEAFTEWLTQERFITFEPQQRTLDFEAVELEAVTPEDLEPHAGRPRRRRSIAAGDELRPGVHAEH